MTVKINPTKEKPNATVPLLCSLNPAIIKRIE